MMEVEEHEVPKKHAKKIRVKIITNRNLQFITSVKPEATISQLANRALSVYLELTGQKLLQSTCKKQLTVAAVKQGVFYMPKSQCVSNILNQDEVVEVIIIKAKPKFPNTVYSNQQQQLKKQITFDKKLLKEPINSKKEVVIQQEQEEQLQNPEPQIVQQEQTVAKKTQQSESKRQKKKQKKKQKNEKKKKLLEEKDKSKENISNDELRLSKEKQISVDSLAKKKIKVQKDEVQNSSQKPPQIIIPSPKITFHADPKMDSPRNFMLGQSQKKKINLEANSKSQDQQPLKKTPLQKILSPHYSLKSPFLAQKTPISNVNIIQNAGRQRQKQQLLNFTLPRKVSEDRRNEPKKDKSEQNNNNDPRLKKQTFIDTKENNSIKLSQPIIEKSKQVKQIKSQVIEQEKTTQKIVPVKPTKNFLIVQPPSDSQSEQKKNIDESIHQNHRFKQLAQINSKIKNFLIDSQEEQ